MGAKGRRVAVIGAGLSGLSTAWFLQREAPQLQVTVLESSDRVGGKLLTGTLAHQPYDHGADAFLFRQPEFAALCEELGLGDDLVAPDTGQVWLWFEDGLKPLPGGTVLGLPGDLDEVERSQVLSGEGMARARQEAGMGPPRLGPDDDPPVAAFVGERFGREVVDRLVDPLLSGVYAGDTAHLGLRSAAPAMAAVADAAVRARRSITEILEMQREAVEPDPRPVFKTVRGGLSRVTDAMAAELDDVRLSSPVRRLVRHRGSWEVEGEEFDAVVLAVPAHVGAPLTAASMPKLSGQLDHITYASATVIALALPHGTHLPEGSGMLVPRNEGRLVKAATWSSRKWPHLADRWEVLLRCSMGRVNDHRHDLMSDEDVIEATRKELEASLGITAEPVDVRVTRWVRGLPQYDSGHRARVAEIRATAADLGVVVTGAAYDGVGLPACVRQAKQAAGEVIELLGA